MAENKGKFVSDKYIYSATQTLLLFQNVFLHEILYSFPSWKQVETISIKQSKEHPVLVETFATHGYFVAVLLNVLILLSMRKQTIPFMPS